MSHIPRHHAPGFGDLLPGFHVVPQNPIRDAGTALVPSLQAASPGKVLYRPHIGDLLPGSFSVPQNPIIRTLASGGPCSTGMAGMGCGGGCGMAGLGDTVTGDSGIGSFLSQSSIISGIPDGVLYAGGILALYLLIAPGGKEYRQKRRSLDFNR